MTAIQSWSFLMGLDSKLLTKKEKYLFEAETFFRILSEVKEIFREKYKSFFYLMKYTIEMENTMLETNYVCWIIEDILETEEYNLQGLAYYTDTPLEILQEIIAGMNKNPSAVLLQRCMDLHRLVRRDLYQNILKKIALEYAMAA